jgi:hypothetical protein
VPYRWLAQGKLPEVDIPKVVDLPWLPEAYLEGLKDDRPAIHGHVDVSGEDVQRLRTEGEPCRAVLRELEKYEERTAGGMACHDVMCSVQIRLLRLGEQLHEGVDAAMESLWDQFDSDRGDYPGRDTAKEFTDAQHTAVEKILAHPTPEERKGCCGPVALTITAIAERLGLSTTTISADQAEAYF